MAYTQRLVTPMRSADLEEDLSSVVYPALISPKFDGYRATVQEGVVLSKNLKPIPNAHVQLLFGREEYNGFDGELIVGDPTDDPLQRTSSGVTTAGGEPAVRFYVFDDFSAGLTTPLEDRLRQLERRLGRHPSTRVVLVPQTLAGSEKALLAYEAKYVGQGFEGLMVRAPRGRYKEGRATLIEGYCSKLKRAQRMEAKVESYYEEMKNTNEAKRNEVGEKQRSSHKANKVGKDTLGGCNVIGLNGRFKGVKFRVGNGWTKEQRKALWLVKDTLPGRTMTVEYGKTPKTFVAPQFPRWKDWRGKADM